MQTKVGENVKHAGWVNIPDRLRRRRDQPGRQRGHGPEGRHSERTCCRRESTPSIPFERQIDIVGVGFWETSISVNHRLGPDGKELLDASGEPEAIPGSGIGFPSNDGFNIQLDFTAIWGVMPKDAPDVVRTFGSVAAAEQKVIIPQSESISRINGSKMGANELLVGETRQKFQTSVSDHFQEVLKDKHLTLLYGLVRHIYIPKDIRTPLQEGYIADELKLTREEEKITKQAEGELREAEKKVLQETEKVQGRDGQAGRRGPGRGPEEGRRDRSRRPSSRWPRSTGRSPSSTPRRPSSSARPSRQADQLMKEATSQKFDLAVKAFGNAGAYTKWQFAEGLPENIQLQLFYAGEGTLWTDLKGMMPTLPLTNPRQLAKPRRRRPADRSARRPDDSGR